MLRHLGKNQSQTYLEFGDLRIQTISNLVFDTHEHMCYTNMSPAYGVGIERKISSDLYIVICFVKYDNKEGCINYEPVGERILDYIGEDHDKYLNFRKTYQEAKIIVEDAVNESGEEE